MDYTEFLHLKFPEQARKSFLKLLTIV